MRCVHLSISSDIITLFPFSPQQIETRVAQICSFVFWLTFDCINFNQSFVERNHPKSWLVQKFPIQIFCKTVKLMCAREYQQTFVSNQNKSFNRLISVFFCNHSIVCNSGNRQIQWDSFFPSLSLFFSFSIPLVLQFITFIYFRHIRNIALKFQLIR